MTNQKLPIKSFLLLTLIAYIFSISIRTIWVYQFKDVDGFHWNNQLMINTNDGYGYAEGARDVLSGTHQKGDFSFIDTPLSRVTALLVKILPFSFETIILWLPAFFGSLLVLPIMLIARVLNMEYAGFIGALLGGITWSYYNRTMVGYYDTDMLTIVLPTLTLWSIIFTIKRGEDKYLFLVSFFVAISNWWYFQNYSLSLAMALIFLIYTIIFHRKDIFYYKVLLFMLLALAKVALFIKAITLLVLFFILQKSRDKIDLKAILILIGISFLIILITGGFDPVIARVNAYIFRGDTSNSDSFHYFSVVKTVREAGEIPFEVFANRISGNRITFILALIGYILLLFKNRVMILSIPLVGLGFIALNAGLRFTVYAVPILALAIGYLIFYISKYIKDKRIKLLFISLAAIGVLIPNILHVIEYRVPTVFTKDEVKVLDKLKSIASREDYVVAWWDYGYPIRYYSDVKTLVDGARHSGSINFPVSFALLRNQIASANMARLAVEYREKYLKDANYSGDFLENVMRDYNIKSVNRLTSMLNHPIELPEKTRDIYYYLPLKMMNIIPTIDLFSNIDLTTGKNYKSSIFLVANVLAVKGGVFYLSNGMKILNGSIYTNRGKLPINKFIITYYENGKLKKSSKTLNIGTPIYVIYMRDYGRILILDKRMYNSAYIQLFVLENYDPNLFEPVILTPLSKVFKLKI